MKIYHMCDFAAAKFLTVLLTLSITAYTLIIFFDLVTTAQNELIFYLIPSLILGCILLISIKSEKAAGVLCLGISIGYLLIYQFSVAVIIFLSLVGIGMLFLLNTHKKVKFLCKGRS